MRRSGFLKSLLSVPLLPGLSSFDNTQKTYAIEDIFDRHTGNDSLLYPKIESPFYKEVIDKVKKSGLIIYDESIVYMGLHDIYFPKKETYTAAEIRNLFDKVFEQYKKIGYVINGDRYPKGAIMRLTTDLWEDRYIPDIYIVNSWSKPTQISMQHYSKEEREALKKIINYNI